MDELETMTDAELDAELRSYGIDPEQLIQNAFQKLCVAFRAQSDRLSTLQQSHDRLLGALKGARFNVAYAHEPENCGDHCRNNCRDCVLRNTLEDLDAAIAEATPEAHE